MNSTYLIVMAFSMIVPFLMQRWLKTTYGKYSQVRNTGNLTGADVAKAMLEANGITDVTVEPVAGQLTDHYDPRAKAVRLSEGNYGQPSVAAMAVAAHEVGHAIQHNTAYGPLAARTALLRPAQIGQSMGPIMVIIGVGMLGAAGSGLGTMVAQIGLVLFAAAALFQLVTLPIEFDASNRAMSEMKRLGLATDGDNSGSRRVLTAAAMTYVAGLATTVAWLLYYASILNRD